MRRVNLIQIFCKICITPPECSGRTPALPRWPCSRGARHWSQYGGLQRDPCRAFARAAVSGAGRLVRVSRQYAREGAVIGYLSVPQMEFWKENSQAFESLAGCRAEALEISFQAPGASGSAPWSLRRFFPRAGVNPVLGRESGLKRPLGGPQAIVLTDGLWRRQFGADPRC